MYPPHPKDLVRATMKAKIIPSRLTVPWTVFAACNWFEIQGHNQSSKLLQVKPYVHPDWEPGTLISLGHCFPMNLVFWPSKPFDEDDYTADGNHNTINEFKKIPITYDDATLYDVITHHEKKKL